MHADQAHLNGLIHLLYKIIKIIIGLIVESEIAIVYANAQEVIPIRYILEELNHF